jgi:hypothetical protein
VKSSDPPQPTVAKVDSDSVSGGVGAGRSHLDGPSIKLKRPMSISGFKSSVSATSSTSIPLGKKPVLPASSLIYQDADVGVDLGSTRRASHGIGFMKPPDVDAPPRASQHPSKPVVSSIVESGIHVEHKKRTIDGPGSPAQFTDVPEDISRKKRKK